MKFICTSAILYKISFLLLSDMFYLFWWAHTGVLLLLLLPLLLTRSPSPSSPTNQQKRKKKKKNEMCFSIPAASQPASSLCVSFALLRHGPYSNVILLCALLENSLIPAHYYRWVEILIENLIPSAIFLSSFVRFFPLLPFSFFLFVFLFLCCCASLCFFLRAYRCRNVFSYLRCVCERASVWVCVCVCIYLAILTHTHTHSHIRLLNWYTCW